MVADHKASQSKSGYQDVEGLGADPELEKLHRDRLAELQMDQEKRQVLQRRGHGEYQVLSSSDPARRLIPLIFLSLPCIPLLHCSWSPLAIHRVVYHQTCSGVAPDAVRIACMMGHSLLALRMHHEVLRFEINPTGNGSDRSAIDTIVRPSYCSITEGPVDCCAHGSFTTFELLILSCSCELCCYCVIFRLCDPASNFEAACWQLGCAHILVG